MYGGNRDAEEMFLVRSVDLDERSEVVYEVYLGAGGKLAYLGERTLSGSNSRGHHQAVVDLMNHAEVYRATRISLGADLVHDDPWPELGYTLHYHCSTFLPLLRIKSIVREDEPRPRYWMDRGGLYRDQQSVSGFFTVLPQGVPATALPASSVKLAPTRPQIHRVNDFELHLDEYWNLHQGDYPGFWISLESERDSQLGIEKAAWSWVTSLGAKDLSGFVRRTVLATSHLMVPATLEAWEDRDSILVEYLSVDDMGQTTYTRLRYLLRAGSVYIVNSSTFRSIFENNREYFEEVLASVRLPG